MSRNTPLGGGGGGGGKPKKLKVLAVTIEGTLQALIASSEEM